MRRRNFLIKAIVSLFLLVFLFTSSGVVALQKKRVISGVGKGLTLNYAEQIYWDEEQFNLEYEKYSKDKEKYLKHFIKNFSKLFLGHSLKATDWSVSFECQYNLNTKETTYLTLIQCKIDGTATGTKENPYFQTEWLLIPILGRGIDLYSFKYLTDKMLSYEGRVNHVPTKITFKFSKPINHCHYHIWYR